MPHLTRPDGTELYWEIAGEGPTAVVCNTFNLSPIDELVERLAVGCRVLTYDPRGVGSSAPAGPYDMTTGADDLAALLESAGPAAIAFGIGDGAHRAVRVAASRPDLIDRVAITTASLGEGSSAGFAGSREVLKALMSLMRRDYRSGLRSMVASAGRSGGTERARVEELVAKVPQEAAVGYLESWITCDSADAARSVGPRLTVVGYPGNAWFPLEMFEDMSLALPDCRYEVVEDGPMSRPDLAADLLLRLME